MALPNGEKETKIAPLGGFKYFFNLYPYLGEMIQFDSYFSDGLKPPTSPGYRFHPFFSCIKMGLFRKNWFMNQPQERCSSSFKFKF